MDTRWKHPFTALCCGPSGSGKTTFVKNFLKYRKQMSDTVFSKIIFYYSEWQSSYKDFDKEIELREGLPQSTDFDSDLQPKLIVIDDFMRESSSNVIVDLFVRKSHHRSVSIFFLSQNLFYKGQRDISLNVSYLVVFKNPRDRAQIQHLARQVYPENPLFIREIFRDATAKPHSYLLFDMTQTTCDELRFRTCIFPIDQHECVYVPKRKI